MDRTDKLTIIVTFVLLIAMFWSVLGHNPEGARWLLHKGLILVPVVLALRFIRALFSW